MRSTRSIDVQSHSPSPGGPGLLSPRVVVLVLLACLAGCSLPSKQTPPAASMVSLPPMSPPPNFPTAPVQVPDRPLASAPSPTVPASPVASPVMVPSAVTPIASSLPAGPPVNLTTHTEGVLVQVSAQVPFPAPPSSRGGSSAFQERVRLPNELPGSQAPPINLPPEARDQPKLRQEIIDRLFPNLPKSRPLALPPVQPGQSPLTLAQLQELAINGSPVLNQAGADVTANYGTAMQAGAYPNPVVGYEADTVGSSRTRNYQGVYMTQTIKTANKLGLARSVANFDLMNSQLNIRKTRTQIASRVKSLYFAVLVAQENLVISDALVRFSNEVYRIQVDKLKGGEATAYEPVQLRAIVVQARANMVAAENRYISAWKQLAAALSVPEMPPTELAGRSDMVAPEIRYQAALAKLLSNHPDVLAARNAEAQARAKLQLETVKPVPDIDVYGTIQRDFSTPNLPLTTYNMQIGVPVPIFDRNRGGIMSAQGALVRAAEQARAVQNELAGSLADAFERYETNRAQTQFYREQVLPDLARAYRGIYERHEQEPSEVGFGDIVVAQQNLSSAITQYIASLNAQWTALADLSNLLQIEDLRELEELPQAPMQPPELLAPPAGEAKP